MLTTNWDYEGMMFAKVTGPVMWGYETIVGRTISVYGLADDLGKSATQESITNGSMG